MKISINTGEQQYQNILQYIRMIIKVLYYIILIRIDLYYITLTRITQIYTIYDTHKN